MPFFCFSISIGQKGGRLSGELAMDEGNEADEGKEGNEGRWGGREDCVSAACSLCWAISSTGGVEVAPLLKPPLPTPRGKGGGFGEGEKVW